MKFRLPLTTLRMRNWTLIDGEGEFTGISGTGALRVRSPMRALITDVAAGAELRVASGLAVIKDLEYSIP